MRGVSIRLNVTGFLGVDGVLGGSEDGWVHVNSLSEMRLRVRSSTSRQTRRYRLPCVGGLGSSEVH